MTQIWQYVDATNAVVVAEFPDGTTHSCLVTAQEYLASVDGGATTIAAPAVPASDQALAAFAKGIGIISTGTPALNGTYPLDMVSQFRITSISASIAAGKGLPEGASTMAYLDSSGSPHVFSAENFLDFAAAVRDFVAEWSYYALGVGSLPDGSKTIA